MCILLNTVYTFVGEEGVKDKKYCIAVTFVYKS